MLTSRRAFLQYAAALTAASARAEPALIPAVATFSILGDFVRQVSGEALELAVIVGPDGDAHVYEPTPADGKTLHRARLVFVNGLGFEGWIDRLIAASKTSAQIVIASEGVTPRRLDGALDPHAWQDAANARRYVLNIRDALKSADPGRGGLFDARANTYIQQLDALDGDVKAAIGRIPKDRRRVVSTHDAFGYFSARYGVEFIAPQGVSTEAEASARDIARIIDAVKKEKVAAVFLENIVDPRLARAIVKDSGAKLGGALYSDALSAPDGAAPNYIAMMRHNVKQLVDALAPSN